MACGAPGATRRLRFSQSGGIPNGGEDPRLHGRILFFCRQLGFSLDPMFEVMTVGRARIDINLVGSLGDLISRNIAGGSGGRVHGTPFGWGIQRPLLEQ